MRSRTLKTPVQTLSFAIVPVHSRALGPVHFGVVWSEAGIVGLTFPEVSRRSVVSRLKEKWPSAKSISLVRAPRLIRNDVARIGSYMKNGKGDLTKIRLDLSGSPPFHRQVYEAARGVPVGRVCSYGELAARLGKPNAARAVGQAMARNPIPLIVPCHRVLASGGFSAPGGVDTKQKLLAGEGYQHPGPLKFPRGRDPAEELRKRSPELSRLIKRIGPYRLKPSMEGGAYEALFRSIIFQQLNGRAAATILGRVKERFQHRFPSPDEVLETKEDVFRSAGLSRNKWLAIRDLAAKSKEGLIPPAELLVKMNDEEIIERLTQIRGIGRWTVEMILIFALGRPDVWPVDDFAIRLSFARLYGLKEAPKNQELRALAEKFRPYRSVLSWYLWRQLDPAEQSP